MRAALAAGGSESVAREATEERARGAALLKFIIYFFLI